MKGNLIKTEIGWMVKYDQRTCQDPSAEDGELPLHPDDVAQINADAQIFDNIEARISAYPEVDFIPITDAKINMVTVFAKLVPFKEQQKQLITKIMEDDAKDGLYEDIIKVTIKKGSELAKYIESLREKKKEFKESVELGSYKTKKQTAIDFLMGELLKNRLLALRYDSDNVIDEIILKAKEIENENNKVEEDESSKLGHKIIEYAKKYEGTDKYNDILLAIEFGYQLNNKQ